MVATELTAAQAVEGYLDHLRVERGVSPHTSAAYRRDLRRYVEFLSGKGIGDLEQVSPLVVAEFAGDLREGDLAPASTRPDRGGRAQPAPVRRRRRDHHLRPGPRGRTHRKAGRRLPKGLSLAEVQALLETPLVETPLGLRDAALLELLYGTGARISEVVGLDVDDVVGLRKSLPTSPGSPMRRPRTRSDCGCSARGARSDGCRSVPTPARRSART